MSRTPRGLGSRALSRAGAADLETFAHRIATVLHALARLTSVGAGVVLMHDGGAPPTTVAVAAVLFCSWITVSTAFDLRTPPEKSRRENLTVAGDLAGLFVAMSLSGGVDSPLRLFVVALPFTAALVLAPKRLGLCAVGAVVGYGLLARPGVPLAVLAIQTSWSTSLGVVVARERERGVRLLAAIDGVRRAVLVGERSDEGTALGQELRDAALAPLLRIAGRIPRADAPELLTLTQELAGAALRLRGVVVELHVLTAGQGGVRGSLEALAQRRSPEARIVVDAPARLPPARLALATGLVRQALRAVADTATEQVGIELLPASGERMLVRVRATPVIAPGPQQAQDALAFRQRAVLAGGTAPAAQGGEARVILEQPSPVRPPAWSPWRSREGARLGVSISHAGGVTAAGLVALVAGGATLPFFAAGAVLLLATPLVVDAATARDVGPVRWVLTTVPVAAGLVVMAGTVGGALDAELPLLVALAPCYALQLSPPHTLGASALTLAGFLLAGIDSTSFLAAYAAAVVIAVLLAGGIWGLDIGLARTARVRRTLVDELAERQGRERRRLAEHMHDETLQLLLAARQDLEEAAEGDELARGRAAMGIARAITGLHGVAGDLDLDDDSAALPIGAERALRSIATGVMSRGGPHVVVDCDPAATGHHDGLVVRLARELIANAVTHADADQVRLRLARRAGSVVLEVSDDGCGVDQARVHDAVGRGHIGLASCRERVAVSGGTLMLGQADGGGTHVRIELPVRAG